MRTVTSHLVFRGNITASFPPTGISLSSTWLQVSSDCVYDCEVSIRRSTFARYAGGKRSPTARAVIDRPVLNLVTGMERDPSSIHSTNQNLQLGQGCRAPVRRFVALTRMWFDGPPFPPSRSDRSDYRNDRTSKKVPSVDS